MTTETLNITTDLNKYLTDGDIRTLAITYRDPAWLDQYKHQPETAPLDYDQHPEAWFPDWLAQHNYTITITRELQARPHAGIIGTRALKKQLGKTDIPYTVLILDANDHEVMPN